MITMDLQDAVDNYVRARNHCTNLVEIHRDRRAGEQGRRYSEVSINRAVIVLEVAAWQAAVQDLVSAILDTARPQSGSSSVNQYNVITGPIRKAVGDFATPNAEKTRALFVSAGFDPWDSWTWSQMGGRGAGVVTVTPHVAAKRINEWMRVRHAIAHGAATLPPVSVLESVRLGGNTSNPSIRLVDAEQCISFFSRLVRLTSNALATHLSTAVDTSAL